MPDIHTRTVTRGSVHVTKELKEYFQKVEFTNGSYLELSSDEDTNTEYKSESDELSDIEKQALEIIEEARKWDVELLELYL